MSEKKSVKHVDWAKSANIYEVNLRQFTPEGTLNAFEAHLPRLAAMGVNILWLMPINPIGKANRKGTLGSYYAVADYKAVNPEFGTLDDFKRVVKKAHELGMKVIIDWVANHTAFDNWWVTEHPDWYKKNRRGEIEPCSYREGRRKHYWIDVVGLDYTQPGLWDAMIDALEFWVAEADIDGYRCDVAGLVPTEFWLKARKKLGKIKPVFMLAEWSTPEIHEAFDMTYDWDLYHVMTKLAAGTATVGNLRRVLSKTARLYPQDAYRMRFTSNHDQNSWHGTDTELFGEDKFKTFAVLAATLPGMALVYGGQEGILDKRLEFFEKDPIDWKGYPLAAFYTDLLKLKAENPALWNGEAGGDFKILRQTTKAVFAFQRRKADNVITATLNLSGERQIVKGKTFAPWQYEVVVG